VLHYTITARKRYICFPLFKNVSALGSRWRDVRNFLARASAFLFIETSAKEGMEREGSLVTYMGVCLERLSGSERANEQASD
jgi:hypothetical protein